MAKTQVLILGVLRFELQVNLISLPQPKNFRSSTGNTVNQFIDRMGTVMADFPPLSTDSTIRGVPIAQAVVKEWGKYLSWGVRGLVGVLNPERIVFGGQLAVLGPYVQEQLDEILQGCLPDGSGYGFDSTARFRLDVSKFGEDSAAIGGAVLVYQSLFQMPDLLLLHQ